MIRAGRRMTGFGADPGGRRVVLPPVAPTGPPASLRPRHPVGVTLAAIIERTGARLAEPCRRRLRTRPGSLLTGVTLRAQDARPGDLFAALPGTRAHGAQFARTRSRPAPSRC